jgi:hypothetical protein
VHTFKPMTSAALLDRTAKAVADGRFELFKTDTQFDVTGRYPEWLG